ncbi:hypothetical protein AB0L40_21630 [Patulibacter sp. NPDC049589]|uniref:hypothetical protein n=1 Tax=Patulibacter sp. NPDC049589 TaxID=3154731 RepID=UPI0034187D19
MARTSPTGGYGLPGFAARRSRAIPDSAEPSALDREWAERQEHQRHTDLHAAAHAAAMRNARPSYGAVSALLALLDADLHDALVAALTAGRGRSARGPEPRGRLVPLAQHGDQRVPQRG